MRINNDCEVLQFIQYASRLRVKNVSRMLKQDISPAFAYVLANELRTNRQILRRCKVFLARLCPDAAPSRNNAQKNRLNVEAFPLSTQKAAELLIISATAEIIGILRRISNDEGCSERVFMFCEKVVESENEFTDKLRSFL